MSNLTTYEYDIFLSHNRADQEWTTKVAERLEQEEWHGRKLRVFFSPWDIRPGQSIPKEIEKALPKSRKVGLVLSPDAMKSAWVELERLVTTYVDVSARDERLIPLLHRDCEIPGLLKPILYIDFRSDSDFEEGYRTLLSVVKEEPLERGSCLQKEGNRIVPAVIPRPPIVGFVNRSDRDGHDLIELLRVELAPSKNQLVTLWGGGGVGKTTLAAEAARALADDFSQRVVWVSADGRSDLPFATLLDDIATQLGDEELRKLGPERKSEAVHKLIAAAPTLIVLDNFETISAGERQQCLDFLTQRAQCSTLITTRQRIDRARSIPVTGMTPADAERFVHLLIEQTQEPEIFAIPYQERLIKTAEANPLIMEWIVGQIDLANDPEEVLNDLTHGEGDAAHRVFDRSYNLPQLNDGGRAVLLALSLFTPSAGRPTLAAVAGMDLRKDRDKKRFKKAQETLASLWLIKTMDNGIRLAVAGLTRELTRAHLATDLRAKTFPHRFVSRFVRYAERHSEPKREDYDALELEKDNLLTATDVALRLGYRKSVSKLALILAVFPDGVLAVRGYWEDSLRLGRFALEVARSSDSQVGIEIWSHNLAVMYHNKGELLEAERLYDQSLALAKQFGDERGVASTLHQLGILAHQYGSFDKAKALYSQSLEIAKNEQDQSGIGSTLGQLATLAQDQGDNSEARSLYYQALEIANKLFDRKGIAITLGGLGSLAHHQGELTEALPLFNQSLEIYRSLGDQSGIAASLMSLGWLSYDRGEIKEAKRLYEESWTICKKIGDQFGIAECLFSFGWLANDRGDLAEAERLYSQSLEPHRQTSDQISIATCLRALGRLRHDRGDLKEAELLFDESLRITQKVGYQGGIAASLYYLGTIRLAEKDYDATEVVLQESLDIFQKIGHKVDYAECLEMVGDLRVAQGMLTEALTLYNETLEIAEKLEVPLRIASVKRALGLLAEKKGNTREAALLLGQSLTIFEHLESYKLEQTRRDLERVKNEIT